MDANNYFYFAKWYFDYLGKIRFDDAPAKIHTATKVRRKERLSIVIFAYLLMVASVLLALILPSGFLISIALLLLAIVLLAMCRFSFLYYYLAYVKYRNRNASVNDRAIVEECILLNPKNDIRNTISKYYRLIDVRGNIFALKYDLVEKTKKYKRLSNKDISVLKITPNKMVFKKKEVFSSNITDLSELDRFLGEAP